MIDYLDVKELAEDIASREGPFISDSAFDEYAMEVAEDMGVEASGWPYDYIDWDRAADALKQDYRDVEFDGETYWHRA